MPKKIEELSDFEKNLVYDQQREEGLYVLSIYKDTELYYEYKLKPEVLVSKGWKVFYSIAQDLIDNGGVHKLDAVTVGTYVSGQTEKFQDLYNSFGGYQEIADGMDMVEESNIETYYNNIQKYQVLRILYKKGFPIEKQWKNLKGMPLEDLNDYFTNVINNAFIDTDSQNEKVGDIFRGMDEMIESANLGKEAGLPLKSKLMENIQHGLRLGNITMLAAHSGVGKSFLTTLIHVQSCIENKEPVLIIANEEDRSKWQQELLVRFINTKHKNAYFNKNRFFDGNFSDKEMEYLKEASDWYKANIKENTIRFVSMESFSMAKTIRLIKKYATMYGVEYFVLDTLKLDNDTGSHVSDKSWLVMQQNMVRLYNVIKESSLNVHVWVTAQLSKGGRNSRYLDQSQLGVSKNIIDVASSVMLVRDVTQSEKDPEAKASERLTVHNAAGYEVELQPEDDYVIVFWDKNRQGTTNEQVVLKVNRGLNTFTDVGTCRLDRALV